MIYLVGFAILTILIILVVYFTSKEVGEPCKHEYELIRRKIETYEGCGLLNKGDVFSVSFKAYQCKKCKEYHFRYSADMTRYSMLKVAKNNFEFEVKNLTNRGIE